MGIRLIRAMVGSTALLAAAACGPKTPCDDPEEVVSRFYGSVLYGDTALAYELTSGADKRILKERASGAQAPGGEPLLPHQMIVPSLLVLPGDLATATIEARKVEVGDVKEVEILFDDGGVTVVPVVREAGCYRVPLGLVK